MKRKYFCMLCLILSNIITSQIINLKLVDSVDNVPIKYATILNKSNSNFTFSDENGNCNITAKDGDSLVITHISYNSLDYYISKLKFYKIKLPRKIITLEDIIISKRHKVKNNVNGNKYSDKTFYGLSLEREYALLAEYKRSENQVLYFNKLILQIQHKKNYNSEGLISITIVEADENDNITSNILIGPTYINLNNVTDKKLECLFAEKKQIPKNKFFIIFKRILKDKQFNKKDKNLSVNPFIYSSKTKLEKTLYIKNIYNNKWIEVNNSNYSFTPIFDYEIISKN